MCIVYELRLNGVGACDTPELDRPELWRGAAGLCARVRACAGATESLHTYIHDIISKVALPADTVWLASSSHSPSEGGLVVV